MKDFICLYEVEYCDIENQVKTEYGLLHVDNFREAMEILEGELYGDDLVKVNSMELFDTAAVFTKETFALMRRELEQGV